MTRGYLCNQCEQFYTGRPGAETVFSLPSPEGIESFTTELCVTCARTYASELHTTEGGEDNDSAIDA